MIVVLTDGYTPWPHSGPKGSKVVIGLLVESPWSSPWQATPEWATTILIEPP